MGTCQSRAFVTAQVEQGIPSPIAGKFDLGGQSGDQEVPRVTRASVKTPKQNTTGRVSLFSKRSSNAARLLSPSEETNATVPATPFPPSFAEDNFSISSNEDDLERSGASLPVVISKSGPNNPINYDSASSSNVDYIVNSPGPSRQILSAKTRENEGAELRMLNSHMTRPESVVYRSAAPLIAPRDVPMTIIAPKQSSTTSVDPQTLANFNRLKIQVQLAEQHELHNRRKAKLEDRMEDVKGYRNLWKEFENIKNQAGGSTGDELEDTAKKASMNLNDPESWYFDFNPMQNMQFVKGSHDENSLSSLSLLSEMTMEAQRNYYKEKSRERQEKREGKQHKPTGDIQPKMISNVKPIASVRTTASRGSAGYSREKPDMENGDVGPVREGTICDIEFAHLCSDDCAPQTRTGRSHVDDTSRATPRDDGSNYISDLDMDNVCEVPRRNNPHRPLDVFKNRSMDDYAKSKIEFDVSDVEYSIGENNQKHAPGLAGDEAITQDDLKACPGRYVQNAQKSSIQKYGFDPSAPLSSQLELFAQSVPSVQIEDGESAVVHWREFHDSGDKTPATARRLDGIFEQDDIKSNQKIEWDPRSFTKPVIGGSTVCRRTFKGGEQENISPTTRVSTAHPKTSRQTPDGQKTLRSYSPLDAMSPSQFLMMSSFVNSGDNDEADNDWKSPAVSDKLKFEDIPDYSSDESELQPPPPLVLTEKEVKKDSANLFVDPNISSLSTDAFLMMSSWPAPSDVLMRKDGIDRPKE